MVSQLQGNVQLQNDPVSSVFSSSRDDRVERWVTHVDTIRWASSAGSRAKSMVYAYFFVIGEKFELPNITDGSQI